MEEDGGAPLVRLMGAGLIPREGWVWPQLVVELESQYSFRIVWQKDDEIRH